MQGGGNSHTEIRHFALVARRVGIANLRHISKGRQRPGQRFMELSDGVQVRNAVLNFVGHGLQLLHGFIVEREDLGIENAEDCLTVERFHGNRQPRVEPGLCVDVSPRSIFHTEQELIFPPGSSASQRRTTNPFPSSTLVEVEIERGVAVPLDQTRK